VFDNFQFDVFDGQVQSLLSSAYSEQQAFGRAKCRDFHAAKASDAVIDVDDQMRFQAWLTLIGNFSAALRFGADRAVAETSCSEITVISGANKPMIR
jgi:hypothetical protein